MEILATTGVRLDSPRAWAAFERASGCTVDGDRVRIPREIVAWALSVAPSALTIYDRRGAPAFTLDGAGQEGVHFGGARFGIGVTNLYYQEPGTNAVTPFTREQTPRVCTRLGDALPSYDVISTIGVLHDVPMAQADLIATLEMIAETTKPLVLLVSAAEAFGPVLNFVEAVCGDLSARPLIIPYFNPVTPLVINVETSDKMFNAYGRPAGDLFRIRPWPGRRPPHPPCRCVPPPTPSCWLGRSAQLIREGAAGDPGPAGAPGGC